MDARAAIVDTIDGFFRNLKTTRRPRPAPAVVVRDRHQAPPARPGLPRDVVPTVRTRPPAPASPTGARLVDMETASATQKTTRNWHAAQELAAAHIARIPKGVYAYRVLKTAFDAVCKGAEIDAVTDARFGRWLGEAGFRRFRSSGVEKVTMYEVF